VQSRQTRVVCLRVHHFTGLIGGRAKSVDIVCARLDLAAPRRPRMPRPLSCLTRPVPFCPDVCSGSRAGPKRQLAAGFPLGDQEEVSSGVPRRLLVDQGRRRCLAGPLRLICLVLGHRLAAGWGGAWTKEEFQCIGFS
jgi:hypothetical protein